MTLLLFLTVTPYLRGETRNPPKLLVSAQNRKIRLRFHLCSSGWRNARWHMFNSILWSSIHSCARCELPFLFFFIPLLLYIKVFARICSIDWSIIRSDSDQFKSSSWITDTRYWPQYCMMSFRFLHLLIWCWWEWAERPFPLEFFFPKIVP